MYKATSFIHGNSISSEKEIKIFSPVDNNIIGTIPQLTEDKLQEAFHSSAIAHETWKQIDSKTKQRYMFEFVNNIKKNKNLLIKFIHLETGKSIKDAESEVERSIAYIIETIHAYDTLIENPKEYKYDDNILIPENLTATYLRQSIGVVLTISPFNYPMNLMISKIVPAILMGNCVVHKSSTQGSLTGWYISKLLLEIEIDKYPIIPGVLNYVTCSGSLLGEFLKNIDTCDKQIIHALSFTGSTIVGKKLSSQLSFIPQQLELGGLNTAILLKDANLNIAIKEILKGAFSFSGQRCTSIKKLLVDQSIHEEVIDLLKIEVKKYLDNFAPLINKQAVDEVYKFYCDSQMHGGVVITDEIDWEEIKNNNSLLVPPIIVDKLSKNMKLCKEEVFGPVLGVMIFKEIDEISKLVNDTDYGLQTSIFSENISLCSDIALSCDVGRVNINLAPERGPDILPFLGIKDSGLETQGIINSLYFFSRYKGIVLKNWNI